MTPQQAAFCVLYPDHREARRLMERDLEYMMLIPENRAAIRAAAQNLSDAIDALAFAELEKQLRNEWRQ